MIERVLGHLAAHGVDEAVLSLGYRPDAFLAGLPRHGVGRGPTPLRRGARTARHRRRHRVRRVHAGIDETFVVGERRRAHRRRPDRLVAFHASARRGGDDLPEPGGRPVAIRRGPYRRRRARHRVRRETSARWSAHELSMQGSTSSSPRCSTRIPPGRRVSVERETFPRLAAERFGVRLGERRLLARHRHAGGVPAGQRRPARRASRPGPPAPDARQVSRGVWALGAPTVRG